MMRQFVGGMRDATSIYELLLSVAPAPIREATAAVQAAELLLMECDVEPTQLRYARALPAWGDVGRHEAENVWEACSVPRCSRQGGHQAPLALRIWVTQTAFSGSHDRELPNQTAERIVTAESHHMLIHGQSLMTTPAWPIRGMPLCAWWWRDGDRGYGGPRSGARSVGDNSAEGLVTEVVGKPDGVRTC